MAAKRKNNPNQFLRKEFLNLRQEILQFRKESIDNDLKLLNHISGINKTIGCLEGKVKTLMWGIPIVISAIISLVLIVVKIFIV